MATAPEAKLEAEIAAEVDAQVAAEMAASAQGAAEAKHSEGVSAPEVAQPVNAACGKCQVEHKIVDMISRIGYRPDLRYICKACHATVTTLTRKGIQVQHLLDEATMVSFFSEAALERRNAQESRMNFGQTRALLKRTMVNQVMKVKKDLQESEWQPLSYYELKGYDVAAIERDCPMETHPVLGATYKLQIHTECEGTVAKEVEERIAQMENGRHAAPLGGRCGGSRHAADGPGNRHREARHSQAQRPNDRARERGKETTKAC